MPQARRLRLVVLVHMPLGDAAGGEAARSREREACGGRGGRHDQRVDPAPAARSSTRCRPTASTSPSPASTPPALGAGDRGRRRAALRRGGDARQGPRRAARRARDGDGPVVALRLRGHPGPRPGVRRRRAPPRADGGLGDRVRFAGPAHRPRARPRVRRRGPARARLARRDVRHGRHRGAGPRPAGPRHRRRRRAARRSGTAADGTRPGLLVPPGDPAALGAALRRWLGDAELRAAPAPGRPRAARDAARLAGHRRPVASAGVLAGAAR